MLYYIMEEIINAVIKNEIEEVVCESPEERKHIIVRIIIYIKNIIFCRSSCVKS